MITSVHIDTARTWRGGQNQVLQLVTGLESLGHPTWLVAHARGELKRRAKEGMRFVEFSPRSEFDPHAAWQLGRVLRDVRPQIVHAHDPMAVSLAAMALQMRDGGAPAPKVVAARRVDFHLKSHAFSKWKYRHVDRFIAASRVIFSTYSSIVRSWSERGAVRKSSWIAFTSGSSRVTRRRNSAWDSIQ